MVDGRRGIVHACCGGLLRSIRSMGWDGTAIWHEKEARRGRNVGHVPGSRRHSQTDGGETLHVERMAAEASQFDGTWHGQKADGDRNGRRKTSVRCAYKLANDHGESRHSAALIEVWSGCGGGGGGGGSSVRLSVCESKRRMLYAHTASVQTRAFLCYGTEQWVVVQGSRQLYSMRIQQ